MNVLEKDTSTYQKKEKRFRVIDGTKNIKQINEQIINEIKSLEGSK